jgi:actin-like ATPase involved in cell morphogenesis
MIGISITALKERFSFVGDPPEPCVVEVLLGGKRVVLDITEQIKESCESLLVDLLNNITNLIETCDADAVRTVMKNIILTGGGSQIRNLAAYLESALNRMGYEDAKVTCAKEPKRIVAAGALKIARVAQDSLWQLSIRK